MDSKEKHFKVYRVKHSILISQMQQVTLEHH